jgi:16S rRNA (guanine527-N7)-methyltransferase
MQKRDMPKDLAEIDAQLQEAARGLGLTFSAGQLRQLIQYLEQLNKWNAAYNLTAIRDVNEQLVMHIFDCMAIVPHLAGLLKPASVLVDVGSGGGLPGVVLAICFPEVQVHCVDTVGKKAAFITQLIGALALTNLHAHHARIENLQLSKSLPAATLITSRAFSSLAEFVRLTRHLIAPAGKWAAMKGQLPRDELEVLPDDVVLDSVIKLQVPKLEAERHLLLLRCTQHAASA